MHINTDKTKALLAVGKRLRRRLDSTAANLQIKLNNTDIEQVTSQKLLGLQIDQDLTY